MLMEDKGIQRYRIDVYMPESTTDVWVYFFSDTPLMGISRGDFLTTKNWPELPYPTELVEVVGVEHDLFQIQGSESYHSINIYTSFLHGVLDNKKLGK